MRKSFKPRAPRSLTTTMLVLLLCVRVLFSVLAFAVGGRMGGGAGRDRHDPRVLATWSELLCSVSPALRSTLYLGLGLGIAQQASGSEAAVYYSPSVLNDAG